MQLAGGISVDGPLAVQAAKQAIIRMAEFPFEAGLEFDRTLYGSLLHSKDGLEVLEVFKVKCLSQFKGE